MLMAIFARALTMCVTKKVEWRGTAYSHTMASKLTTSTPTGAGCVGCRSRRPDLRIDAPRSAA